MNIGEFLVSTFNDFIYCPSVRVYIRFTEGKVAVAPHLMCGDGRKHESPHKNEHSAFEGEARIVLDRVQKTGAQIELSIFERADLGKRIEDCHGSINVDSYNDIAVGGDIPTGDFLQCSAFGDVCAQPAWVNDTL